MCGWGRGGNCSGIAPSTSEAEEEEASVEVAGVQGCRCRSFTRTAPRRSRSIPQGQRAEQGAQGEPAGHHGAPATVPRRGPAWHCREQALWKGRASQSP